MNNSPFSWSINNNKFNLNEGPFSSSVNENRIKPNDSPFSSSVNENRIKPNDSPFSSSINENRIKPNDSPFSSSINENQIKPYDSPFSSSINENRINLNEGPFSSSINDYHRINLNEGPFSSSIIKQPIIEEEIDSPTIRESEVRDDTDVLFISTHGSIMCTEIECDIENKPTLTKIPEGMEVIKITLATEGCINIMTEGIYNFAIVLLNYYKNKLLSMDDNVVNKAIDDVAKEIKSIQIHKSKYMLSDINKTMRKSSNVKKIKKQFNDQLDFIYTAKNSVKKFVLKEGDFIMNKEYSRSYEDERLGEKDFAIMAINSINEIDVLSEMRRKTRFGSQKITTEELLDYFKKKGTNKLIIFDYSCSVYNSSYYDNGKKYIRKLSNMENRRLRRETTNPYGGYKYKRTRKFKKSKSKKNRKSRKSKKNRKSKKK